MVEDLTAAQALVAALPDVVAVTRDGDVLSAHFASGGSSAQPSLIEVQAAIDDAESRLADGQPHAASGSDSRRVSWRTGSAPRRQAVEVTLARLHESDAAWPRWPRSWLS